MFQDFGRDDGGKLAVAKWEGLGITLDDGRSGSIAGRPDEVARVNIKTHRSRRQMAQHQTGTTPNVEHVAADSVSAKQADKLVLPQPMHDRFESPEVIGRIDLVVVFLLKVERFDDRPVVRIPCFFRRKPV